MCLSYLNLSSSYQSTYMYLSIRTFSTTSTYSDHCLRHFIYLSIYLYISSIYRICMYLSMRKSSTSSANPAHCLNFVYLYLFIIYHCIYLSSINLHILSIINQSTYMYKSVNNVWDIISSIYFIARVDLYSFLSFFTHPLFLYFSIYITMYLSVYLNIYLSIQ